MVVHSTALHHLRITNPGTAPPIDKGSNAGQSPMRDLRKFRRVTWILLAGSSDRVRSPLPSAQKALNKFPALVVPLPTLYR